MAESSARRPLPMLVPLVTAIAVVLPVAAIGLVALHVATESIREGARMAKDTVSRVQSETRHHLLEDRKLQLRRSVVLRARRIERSVQRIILVARSLSDELSPCLGRPLPLPIASMAGGTPFQSLVDFRGKAEIDGSVILRGRGDIVARLAGLAEGLAKGRFQGRLRGPADVTVSGRLDGRPFRGRLVGRALDHRLDALVEGRLGSLPPVPIASAEACVLEGDLDGSFDGRLANGVKGRFSGHFGGVVAGTLCGAPEGTIDQAWSQAFMALSLTQRGHRAITASYMATPDGLALACAKGWPPLRVPASLDVRRRPWFVEALGTDHDAPWITRPYVDALGGEICFTVLSRIRNAAGRHLATLGLDVRVEHLHEILRGDIPGAQALLVERDGRILVREGHGGAKDRLPVLPEIMLQENFDAPFRPAIVEALIAGRGLVECSRGPNPMVVQVHGLTHLPWLLVEAMDPALLTEPIERAARRATGAAEARRDLSIRRQARVHLRLLTALAFFGIFATVLAILLFRSRRRTERARRESEERNRLLIEHSNDGILLVLDGTIRFANEQACRLLRCRRSPARDLHGLALADLFPEASRSMIMASIGEAVAAGRVHRELNGSMRILDGDVLPAEWVALPLPHGARVAVLFEFRDLSERRLFETRLVQSQKLESLGVLAGGIAHDFNNLLTGIIGNAALLNLDLPTDDPSRGPLEQIEKTARRASALVRQILAYAGKTELSTRSLDVSTTLSDIAELMAIPLGKEADLVLDLAPDLPPVEADPSELQQAVLQLVTNAAEALPEGRGTVRVRSALTELDRSDLDDLSGPIPGRAGPHVLIEVSNDGPPIPPELRQRLFDPFFTTKFMGRGLGLSTVLGIMRGHGGFVDVGRRDGRTAIRLFLPLRPPETDGPWR